MTSIGDICSSFASLPAAGIAQKVNGLLQGAPGLVISAPPGAGKSTLLPLTILAGMEEAAASGSTGSEGRMGRILMLEPRRLAARQIAERMAAMLGESVGQTVGYRVRFESAVSEKTRIEVLTEGILTRMMTEDPTLDGVSVLIFDEFHERSLISDEALALARETVSLVRPDLKIVIMSATIDTDFICRELGLPSVESEGRMFPVEIIRSADVFDTPMSLRSDNVAAEVARLISRAHREQGGDILAFLPGEAEIRRCEELLRGSLGNDSLNHEAPGTEGPEQTVICPLYGMMDFQSQRRAIAPAAPGQRKIVLATPIAETSLTIEGVRVVVDSGLCRRLAFNPQNGLSALETMHISLDMARQRSGRAGRVAPGVCYRMWSEAAEKRLAADRTPEILEADLTPLLLDLAAWGAADAAGLPWLTPPPRQNLAKASGLLVQLGALDAKGMITKHGRRLAALPCHPRIAQMLISAWNRDGAAEQGRSKAAEQGQKAAMGGPEPLWRALAADIAALLEERDPLPQEDSDLGRRLDALRRARGAENRKSGTGGRNNGDAGREQGRSGRWSRTIRAAAQYMKMVRADEDNSPADPFATGVLVANAYPERIAKAHKDGCGKFILSGGEIAAVDSSDIMASYQWLAVASLSARKDGVGRIFLASPLDPADVPELSRERDIVAWDSREGRASARHERTIGCLTVASNSLSDCPREAIVKAICDAAPKEGLSMFGFDEDYANLSRRIAAVAAWHPEMELPELGTEALLGRVGEWLPLYIDNATTSAQLKKIDLCEVAWGLLSYEQQQAVERLAPSHIAVPTGSRIRVEYRLGAEAPVLRVRLQECFGLTDTPRVDGGRLPVLMELLSPGYKSVQLTSDLRSFWEGTYFEVRKELRRRYPKHSWPDNPLEAEAVRGVKKR